MPRLRPALLLSLLAALAFAVAACGGSDESGSGNSASSETDVDELLTQTFDSSKKIESGNLNLALKVEAQGGEADQLGGPVRVSLTGPFQSQGTGKLPKFRLQAKVEGGGQNIEAGATSTGERGFVSFQGTDYAVDDQIFQQFKAGYAQAQKQQAGSDQQAQSFASLGMDPRKWLTDPRNAGEVKVGDEDTIEITGGVDMAKLLDDVNVALERASSLGLDSTGQVPEKLTEQQRRQVLEAVKDPRVEIYTGKDDRILRRIVVNVGIEDAGTSGSFAFDVSITDLNEEQEISEPAGAKPFSELLGQLGGLGLAAGGGGGADGNATDGSNGGGMGSGAAVEKYSKCVTDAGNDLDKVRKCSELLAAP